MSSKAAPGPFICNRRRPTASLRLFCFPYAGGNAAVFREWSDYLPSDVEVLAAELPGHGSRVREAPINQVGPAVDVLARAIQPYLDRRFAFFGHSMGATIAFELCHVLRSNYNQRPVHLFVSGRSAPHIPRRRPPTYNLPLRELVDELRRLNGTPREVLESPDMIQFLLPTLRADFELIETYQYSPRPQINCALSAFAGKEDPDVPVDDVEAWREYTSACFRMTVMPGDHFFIERHKTELLRHLSRSLAESIPASPVPGCAVEPERR